MRDEIGTRRSELAKLAARQHGVITSGQLHALGYSRSAVSRRTRKGSLDPIFPGVFRVGGSRLTLEQRAVAAVLWTGDEAVTSHDTAGAMWQLCEAGQTLHVSSPRRLTSPPRGIQTHAASIAKRDRGKLRGVPVTSVARTLLDLAVTWPEDRLVPVVERAVLDGLTTSEQVQDVLGRNRGRRGSRRLAQALDTGTSSALERRVEAILRDSGLPKPQREYAVGRFRLDFAWPSAKVGLEADGRRWHSSRLDFERDRAKDNVLTDRGWRVLRATARDLDDPGPFLEALARLLAGR